MSPIGLVDLLRDRLGLNPEAISPRVVPAAAEARMQALGISNLEAYITLASTSAAEFQELIEHVVVAESWFFRGDPLFDDLAQRVRARAGATGRTMRILSVGCSTGEEPYSLAIALMEQGAKKNHWTIDGVDVSERHLAAARAGRYGELSFRQTAPELRARYFEPAGRKWQLRADVLAAVRLRLGNVVAPMFLQCEAPYDLILCRNLFIYLHAKARQRALANLDRLLALAGLLCLGHAEPLEPDEKPFEHLECEGGLLYCRSTAQAARLACPSSSRPVSRPKTPSQPLVATAPAIVSTVQEATAKLSGPKHSLADAQSLADAGNLSRAQAVCEALLRESGPSANVYALLGLIHQGQREVEKARHCFEKALYLVPEHEQALTQLRLLYRECGETARAELLENRLRRVATGGEA